MSSDMDNTPAPPIPYQMYTPRIQYTCTHMFLVLFTRQGIRRGEGPGTAPHYTLAVNPTQHLPKDCPATWRGGEGRERGEEQYVMDGRSSR